MKKKRVCILNVGGTIGMIRRPEGLVPDPGVVERYLHSIEDWARPQLPIWQLVALKPLVDSANMAPADWERVARAIVTLYHDYDGFVVLHGTDTMVYTASALSFLLHGLDKPIIFTGAQLSLADPRTDGRQHLVTALILASTLELPEVCVYFAGQLLRGNRAQKVNNNDFVAYASGNLPPLARVGVRVDVNRHLVRPAGDGVLSTGRLARHPSVLALRVFPGMRPEMLRQMFAPPTEGVVLETYGAGTFPTGDAELVAAVAEAVSQGVVVVNCSQCHSGRVLPDLYATSRPLVEAGVISGADMTPEAALTKLFCLLGADRTVQQVRVEMAQDMAGELSE